MTTTTLQDNKLTCMPLTYIGPAIWVNQDSDIPIFVKGYWGQDDSGRHYFKTNLGEGGCPVDQVKPIGLSSEHLKQLVEESAIGYEEIISGGYRTVDGQEAKKYGFLGRQARAGLLYPIFPPDNSNGVYQLRPDSPRKNSKGNLVKYEWRYKVELRLDILKKCLSMLKDTSKPVVFVEGRKKASSLASHTDDFCIVNLPGGVYGYRNVKGVLPDLDFITWQGRQVFILFDSDVMTKKEVKTAMRKLTQELVSRGATVSPVILPHSDNGKTGIDDFFASGHTIDDLLLLMESGKLMPIETDKDSDEGPTIQDYIDSLANLGNEFKLNTIDDSIECNGKPLTDAWADDILAGMWDLGFKTDKTVKMSWGAAAHRNQYNPLEDYLSGLVWDGKPNIDTLASHFKDTTATKDHPCPTFHIWIKKFFIGSVAKIRMPGKVQIPMLVLDGKQSLGKSFFVRYLCPLPEYHIEAAIDTSDKDSYLRLIRSWIWEVSELGAIFRKSDREALKAFITTQVVTVRRSFGKFDLKKPAMAAMVGTLNNEGNGFLTDPTGNRRFNVVTLTDIDWNYAKLDINQIWAEAVHLFNSGESWELSKDEVALRDHINKDYEQIDPIENYIDRFFDVDLKSLHHTLTAEIIANLQDLGLRGNTKSLSMNLAPVLTKKRIRKGKQGGQWGYFGIELNESGIAEIEARKNKREFSS